MGRKDHRRQSNIHRQKPRQFQNRKMYNLPTWLLRQPCKSVVNTLRQRRPRVDTHRKRQNLFLRSSRSPWNVPVSHLRPRHRRIHRHRTTKLRHNITPQRLATLLTFPAQMGTCCSSLRTHTTPCPTWHHTVPSYRATPESPFRYNAERPSIARWGLMIAKSTTRSPMARPSVITRPATVRCSTEVAVLACATSAISSQS